jgi:type IV pilus biogenesis protein CpaD/CtpE
VCAATGRQEGVEVRKTDARVQDPLVLDEIELYGELVIAASASDQRLSQAQIDQVLGVHPETSARD